jgi:predicted dehydrogenase/threonine dehydrogenase-like Zn-dependent dehydrogenase
MKQVFFDGKGKLLVKDVPAPVTPDHGALVHVEASLISSGTELVQAAGGGSLLRKALAQPELIGRAIQLALREGLGFAARAVQDVSETWIPAGYSAAGVVVETGAQADVSAGQHVACGGAGVANHAEFIAVPRNLMTPMPEGVAHTQAAFTTVGAIALQGVRRAEVTLGETVVVVGLGLIGQITAQLLDAAGCRVIGSDPISERRDLAAKLSGAWTVDPSLGDAVEQVMRLTGGVGADKVILCAATPASEPANQAFEMCRERGRVVMVGAMGMDLARTVLYQRELDFVISRSTGPGRYDPRYEIEGIDYPIGQVRWTEQRNMAAFLQFVADGKVDVESLISATYPIAEAVNAYEAVQSGALAVLLTYGEGGAIAIAPTAEAAAIPRAVAIRAAQPRRERIGVTVVGAGNFVRAVHLPNLKASPLFSVQAVVSGGGASAAQLAEKAGATLATSDLSAALAEPGVDAVLIATRHHLHAEQAIAAAQAGKHIFLEKPMGMTVRQCEAILDATREAGVLLTVGFNRRAAPTARALKAALDATPGPKTLIFRVNAGPLPDTHWLLDPVEGGGRLLGEGVHFIDFICGMVGASPTIVTAQGAGQDFELAMRFLDGSLGVVLYTALGSVQFPKERVEVFAGGGVAVLDDFRSLALTGMAGKGIRGAAQDKGQRALLDNFGAAICSDTDLIVTCEDGLRATRIALAALESMRTGQAILLADGQGSG